MRTPRPKVETVPDDEMLQVVSKVRQIHNWAARMSELMYDNTTRVVRIANLAIKDRGIRLEFIEKAKQLLESEGYAL